MGRQFAYFLAIDRYAEPSEFPPLSSSVKDAKALASLLETDFHFETRLLLESDCTKDAVEELLEQTEPDLDDVVLLYLSGHGYEDEGGGDAYFVPYDGEEDDPQSWIDFDDVVRWCSKIPAWTVLLFIDLCHAGYFLHRRTADSGQIDTRKYVYALAAGLARQRVEASGPGGHSPFAASMMKALGGWAGVGESEAPHRIPLRSLASYVQRDVAESVHPVTQWPIGGYLLRDVSSDKEFKFEPVTERLRPNLVANLLESSDPLVITLGLGELIELLGLRAREPVKYQLDDRPVYVSSEEWEQVDPRIRLFTRARERMGVRLRRNDVELSESEQALALEAFLRLLKRTPHILPKLEGEDDIDRFRGSIDETLMKSIAAVVHSLDKVSGGVEAVRQLDLRSVNKPLLDVIYVHLPGFIFRSVTGDWHKELKTRLENLS